jgi:hypothetical protein
VPPEAPPFDEDIDHDLEPPPPLPPAPVAPEPRANDDAPGGGHADAAVVAHRAPRGAPNLNVMIGSGYICISKGTQSLDAHCTACSGKVDRKSLRRLRARAPNTRAQGRPMGLLLAWLESPCPGEATDHRAVLKHLPYATRKDARLRAVASGDFADALDAERSPNTSESEGEPHGVA